MPAKIDTKFSPGFFLTEEALTKVENVVSQRLSQGANYEQKFDAHRVDDAVTSYPSSANLVQQEENSKRNAVKGLVFEASSSLGKVALSFKKQEKTRLTIESPDRDLALLLSADLKEYLRSEVLIRRYAFLTRLIEHRAVFPILIMVSFLPVMIYALLVRNDPRPIDTTRATLDQKIDYLVKSTESNGDLATGVPLYGMLIPIGLFVIVFLLGSDFVYPGNTFYWGKEMSRYESAKKIRGNIFWIIVVGLAVSIVASYVTNGFGRLR